MTERTYYADPYRRELKTTITSSERAAARGGWCWSAPFSIPKAAPAKPTAARSTGMLLTGLVEEGDEIIHLLTSDPGTHGPVRRWSSILPGGWR